MLIVMKLQRAMEIRFQINLFYELITIFFQLNQKMANLNLSELFQFQPIKKFNDQLNENEKQIELKFSLIDLMKWLAADSLEEKTSTVKLNRKNFYLPILETVTNKNGLIFNDQGVYNVIPAIEHINGRHPITSKRQIVFKVAQQNDSFLFIIGSNGCLQLNHGVSLNVFLNSVDFAIVMLRHNGKYCALAKRDQFVGLYGGVHLLLYGSNSLVLVSNQNDFNLARLLTYQEKFLGGLLQSDQYNLDTEKDLVYAEVPIEFEMSSQ